MPQERRLDKRTYSASLLLYIQAGASVVAHQVDVVVHGSDAKWWPDASH